MINNCVGQARPKGGSAKNFSEFHRDAASRESSESCQMTTGNLILDVYLRSEEDDTQCYGNMPSLADASCRYLLNHLPTDLYLWYFGPSTDPEPVDYETPHTVVSRE